MCTAMNQSEIGIHIKGILNKKIKSPKTAITRPYIARLYKPVSGWLKMLPHRIAGLNMQEYFLLDINEIESKR